MSNGTGMTVLDKNIFAHVELFILEYTNITCSIQVVHRIQEWMEGKLQTYFKRDTECLNHNMWMISCMLLSCCCGFFSRMAHLVRKQ